MKLSRREFLRLTCLVAAGAALSSCAPFDRLGGSDLSRELPGLSAVDFMALNRMTFGATPAEHARAAEIGLHAWVEEQLAPSELDDLECRLRLRNLSTLDMDSQQLFDLSDKLFDDVDRDLIPSQLRQGTLIRQVYSRRQLYEVMVEFWNDHFNIATDKGECYFLKTVDDRQVARTHALGTFRDLLWASSHSPAMLIYLDNQANHKGAPNENYARELLELHSLGVEGGYSQADVMELARCLTGWGVKQHFWRGEFRFDDTLHDSAEKCVMGDRILPAGQSEAEGVVERLSRHPAAARFLAFKLARRFLADDPPAAVVQKAATAFERTGGDIRTTLRVILLDGLPQARPKYRRPLNFITAALRMLGAQSDCGSSVQDYLLRMGQPLFNWPTPDGFPDRSEAWQGNLLPRWQFAFALARNEIPKTRVNLPALVQTTGVSSPGQVIDALARLLLGSPLPSVQRDSLLGGLPTEELAEEELLAVVAGGLLASPAFQWR